MRFAESARLHQNLLDHKARENSTFEVRYSAGGLPRDRACLIAKRDFLAFTQRAAVCNRRDTHGNISAAVVWSEAEAFEQIG